MRLQLQIEADVYFCCMCLPALAVCQLFRTHLNSTHLIFHVTMDTEAAGLKLSPPALCTPRMLTDREKELYRGRFGDVDVGVM